MAADRTADNPPVFQAVFGDDWDKLPEVFHKHYAVRANSDDHVRVEGTLDVRVSAFVGLMARLTGMLVSYSGDGVPVSVDFTNGNDPSSFYFRRVFNFPGRQPVAFTSRMEAVGGNELIEFMRFGVGWKMAYDWDGEKVVLSHRGYVWRVFGVTVPIPLSLVMGKGYAEEVALSDDRFSMWTHSRHPFFGDLFGYSGSFKVTEVSCGQS